MNVTSEKIENVTVVIVHASRLDAGNVKDFKTQAAAFAEPNAKVVLDMSEVEFVDSSGCGSILSFLRQLKNVGGDLNMCSVTKPVWTLFALVKMPRVLDIFNTREEAVRAYHV